MIAIDGGDLLRELIIAALLAIALAQSGRVPDARPRLERCREIWEASAGAFDPRRRTREAIHARAAYGRALLPR